MVLRALGRQSVLRDIIPLSGAPNPIERRSPAFSSPQEASLGQQGSHLDYCPQDANEAVAEQSAALLL